MKYILLSLFACCAIGASAENQTLFEIGKKDHSASEFALSPNQYQGFLAQFTGEKSYYVGYSTAKKHWPYALPGPLDQWGGGGYWAGYHPRHFPSIYFNLDKTARKGEAVLTFSFVGVNKEHPSRMRIEINGHRFEEELQGENTAKLLNQEGETGIGKELSLRFPAAWLQKGMNRIQLGMVKGTWVMFDGIRLETPASAKLSQASSTLVRSVEAAPFEYETEGGTRMQPVHIGIHQFDSSRELTFTVEGCAPVTRVVEAGESIQEVLMPAALNGASKRKTVTVSDGERMVYECEV